MHCVEWFLEKETIKYAERVREREIPNEDNLGHRRFTHPKQWKHID